MSIPCIPRGPACSRSPTTTATGPSPTSARSPTARSPPGRVLVNTATILLGVLAAGLLAVSLAAQYQYILRAKHQSWPAIIEAVALDAGMIIFSLLALGLARGGQTARIERALIVVCASGSAAMNYAGADVSFARSVAAYVMPPVFLAIVTDRVIAVVRRHVLGMAAERSAWATLGRAAIVVLAAAGKAVLYGLRLALAPRSTLGGARRSRCAWPGPVTRSGRSAPGPGPAPSTSRRSGETKKAHLASLYADHPTFGNRAPASRTAAELAPHAQLSEGTARAYIYSFLTPEEAS